MQIIGGHGPPCPPPLFLRACLCMSRRAYNTRVILILKLLAILLITLYQLTISPSNQLTEFEAASYKMFPDTCIFINKVFNAQIYKGQ